MQLTALHIEVTHWRVKRKYWKISLAVQNEMSPHRVEHSSIAKDPQINMVGIDILKKGYLTLRSVYQFKTYFI